MGMRIKTNTVSQMAQRHLGENYKTMSHTMERLSSGKRINRSSDDSAGLAVSANMTAQIRGMQQAKRNSMDAVSMLQVAEGGMNEMTNIMVRMLSIQFSLVVRYALGHRPLRQCSTAECGTHWAEQFCSFSDVSSLLARCLVMLTDRRDRPAWNFRDAVR